MAIATLSEFASYVQKDVDTASAALALAVAEGLVVGAVGVQTTWPAVAKGVQLSAAARIYNNPNGYGAESAGARSYSGAVGGVALLPHERAMLTASVGRSGVYSVRLSTPADTDYPYVP